MALEQVAVGQLELVDVPRVHHGADLLLLEGGAHQASILGRPALRRRRLEPRLARRRRASGALRLSLGRRRLTLRRLLARLRNRLRAAVVCNESVISR